MVKTIIFINKYMGDALGSFKRAFNDQKKKKKKQVSGNKMLKTNFFSLCILTSNNLSVHITLYAGYVYI